MKTKIVVFSVVFTMILIAVVIAFLGPFPRHEKTSVVTNFAQSSKGFWKGITVEVSGGKEATAPAFFCNNSGGYIGHVVNYGQGWWTVYVGDDKKGSYASEDFAKREVESIAECK